VREDWRDQSEDIIAGDIIRGDCDDFAVCLWVNLSQFGVWSLDKISLIYCTVENGGGHLVCGYECDDTTYILDNRQRTVWDWSQLRYTWIKRRKASEKEWRLIQ
jgi:predicted transglutaminase-like cysteine proteinase